MAQKPETKFYNRIRPFLDDIPHSFWIRVDQRSHRGDPDIIGCINGQFIALELKKDDKTNPSKLQDYVLKRIADTNGIALVLNPQNFEESYAMLMELSCNEQDDEEESIMLN